MIRLESVGKQFMRGASVVRAVDNVSLEIPKGALALLSGPSGGGKTTLINLCAGLVTPDSGAVTVAGERVDRMSSAQCARFRSQKVSVVFQMFHLVPFLSVIENVMLPAMTVPIPDAARRAGMLLERLGMEERRSHSPSELSAGERQRCALARALMTGPEVLLADEPTGNLDEESARLVLGMLSECRDGGATVLLVSHQPVGEVRPDLRFRMEAGKVTAAVNGGPNGGEE